MNFSFKLQSRWQELRVQQRQILSTKVFWGETSIRLRGQPQLRCVSVSFLFYFIFFQIVSENHPFFFRFWSFFLLFFYFFLTGKNLISCELSCKKKNNNNNKITFLLVWGTKEIALSFLSLSQFCQLENWGIARFCWTTFMDFLVIMWRLSYFFCVMFHSFVLNFADL